MKIKNLINYLGQLKSNVDNDLMIEPINEVIEILEKVEENGKYKKMWEELEEMFKPGKTFYVCKNKNFQEQAQKIMDLEYIIDELKEKYIPKPFKKTVKIEVESKNESKVDDGIKDIEVLVDQVECMKITERS